MRKDQQEELRRLEEALLEQDSAPAREDSDRWLEDFYIAPVPGCKAYNTDRADVDMEDYSAQVHAGKSGRGCLVGLVILLTAVLCALVGFLLWKQGVIPWV